MIVRILGEGQFDVPEGDVGRLNDLDEALTEAIEAGQEDAFAAALLALVEAVRAAGTPLPDDSLQPSDAIVPAGDSGVEEVTALLRADGLIPD